MPEAERIQQLAEAVRYHRELYYNHAAPEISDADFDSIWDELKQLDPDNEVLHKVGPEPLPGTLKVEHMFPMMSLDKGTSDEDIIHFVTQSTTGGIQYLAQPKLGGSALSLEYIAGNLHRAATRGSGEKGEDVTLNAKQVANIPTRLYLPVDCHVRGEVVMPLANKWVEVIAYRFAIISEIICNESKMSHIMTHQIIVDEASANAHGNAIIAAIAIRLPHCLITSCGPSLFQA